MGSRREFNIVNSGPESDREDILTLSRFELSTNDLIEEETGSIGINIYFTINEMFYDKDKESYYEIYRVIPKDIAKRIRKNQKQKTDTINILSAFTDTNEIRNLADWLHEQADEIDKELKRAEEEE